jgi:hypothetical protein
MTYQDLAHTEGLYSFSGVKEELAAYVSGQGFRFRIVDILSATLVAPMVPDTRRAFVGSLCGLAFLSERFALRLH